MDSGFFSRTGPGVAPFVYVFPPGASGDVAPVRVITGRHVDLDSVAIAVDSFGYIYVVDFLICPISILAPGAHGDAFPVGKIDCTDAPASLNLVDDRTMYTSAGPVNEFSRITRLQWRDQRRISISSGFSAVENHIAYVAEGSRPGIVEEYRLSDFGALGTLTVPSPEFKEVWRVAVVRDGAVYLEAFKHKHKPAAIAIFGGVGKSVTSPTLPSAYIEGSNTGFGSFLEGLRISPGA